MKTSIKQHTDSIRLHIAAALKRMAAIRISTRTLNCVLAAAAAVLAALCVASVYAPIRFDRERARRETEVKRRLVTIRTAAEQYRQRTGAYTGSLETLKRQHLIADSTMYIPYSGGLRFHLEATALSTGSGRTVPVMECSAMYDEYLRGLDANHIRNITVEAETAGRFAGLKIGSLDTPGDNAGNWE